MAEKQLQELHHTFLDYLAEFRPRGEDLHPFLELKLTHSQHVAEEARGLSTNLHVVSVTAGGRHFHAQYDEVHYVLNGEGTIVLDQQKYPLRPGAVVVIPAGVPHSLQTVPDQKLEFVIFGTPPVPITDQRAAPQSSGATQFSVTTA